MPKIYDRDGNEIAEFDLSPKMLAALEADEEIAMIFHTPQMHPRHARPSVGLVHLAQDRCPHRCARPRHGAQVRRHPDRGAAGNAGAAQWRRVKFRWSFPSGGPTWPRSTPSSPPRWRTCLPGSIPICRFRRCWRSPMASLSDSGGNDEFTKVLLPFGQRLRPTDNVGGSAHTWTAAGNASHHHRGLCHRPRLAAARWHRRLGDHAGPCRFQRSARKISPSSACFKVGHRRRSVTGDILIGPGRCDRRQYGIDQFLPRSAKSDQPIDGRAFMSGRHAIA